MINTQKENIEWINQKLTTRIFWEDSVWFKKEQVKLLNSSFLSHKENRINIMLENINKNNIWRDKLKEQKITLDVLDKYKQKDDLPLNIQDAIMREFAGKILANLDENVKYKFGEKFDTLLRSHVKIDIKTLEEFKPYIKWIDEDKLSISNEEIVWFLNDNNITNINPLNKVSDWGIYDQTVFMELLYLENKEYFEKQNNIESGELAKAKELLTAPNLDNRNQSNSLILKRKNEETANWENKNAERIDYLNTEIKKFEQEIKKAQELKIKNDIKYYEFRLNEAKLALIEVKEENKIIVNINKELHEKIELDEFEKILQNKKTEFNILEKKETDGKEEFYASDRSRLHELNKEIQFLEKIKEGISKKSNIEDYIKNIKDSGVLTWFNINENDFANFTQKLYNLDTKESNISMLSKVNGNLNLAMSKSFDEDNIVNINIDLNKSDKETINRMEDSRNYITNWNTNKNGIFYSILTPLWDVRIADWYKIKVDGKYEWYLDSSVDCGDEDMKNINKSDYPNMFDEDWEVKPYVSILCDKSGKKIVDDNGKYIFINQNKCENNIEVLDRQINIKWSQADMLMWLFVAWNKQKPGMKWLKNILNIDENDASDRMKEVFDKVFDEDKINNKDNKWNTIKSKINISEPSKEEIMANTLLDDDERLAKAKELLEKIAKENDIKLNPDLFESGFLDLVLFAHYSTVINENEYNELDSKSQDNYIKLWDKYHEIWEDGERVAGVFNYTKKQLKEKIKILQSKVWFENWQIKALLKYGLCGLDPNAEQDKEKWKKLADEWIENQINYADEEFFSYDDAKYEAMEAYNKLWETWKKKFLKTLESTDTNIEDIESNKSEIVEELKKQDNNNTKNTTKTDNWNTNNQNEWNQEGEKNWEKINEATEEEKFEKAWNDIAGYKFLSESHNGFVKWTRLFMDIWDSLLPPDDVSTSFVELEIVDTNKDNHFYVKIIGSDIDTNLDGKIIKLPQTDKQIEKMSAGNIYKMPAWKRENRDNCLSTLEKTQIFDKVSVFGTGPTQTMLKWGKFVNGSGEEITHFCRTIETYDIVNDKGDIKKDKMGQTSVVTSYKVKPLKNGKILVECDFVAQDQKDFTKNLKYNHKKEMDYTNFMLLMESKQLYGKTEEPKNKIDPAQTGERDPMKWQKSRFYSIMSIFDTIKGIWKNITDKVDEYQKEQQEDFQHLLCSHEWLDIYSKMGSFFGVFGWLFEWMENGLQSAGLEYYADREGRTWKKIEKRLNLYEKDPHFSTLWKEKLWPILEKEWPLSMTNDFSRYQYAAAFLFMLKKDGPWNRELFKKMGKWFWVEKFLGPKHKTRFLEMQQKRKNELEEYKKLNIVHRRQPRHTELSRLEFDYMVWVIDGRQPFGWVLGDDEHYQASKWSRTFAEKIQEWADNYFGGFDEKYKKIWRISFRQAEQEWFRHMGNFRPHKALPYLKAMTVNAQSRAEEDRAKAAILGAMLTWVFRNMQDQNLRSEFWKISRTMWFLPGLWIRDTEQQENVAKMLDWITSKPPFKQKFSDAVGYNIGDYQIDNFDSQKKLPFLLNTFPRYWKAHWKKILEILQFQEREEDNSIIKLAETWPNQWIFKFLLEKSRESIREDIDDEVAGTYWFYEHSPLTANKGIVSKIMPNRGKFDMSDNNMKEGAELFWDAVWKNDDNMIPAKKVSRGTTEFIFGKYFNWLEDSVFTQGNLAFLIKWLWLVKKLKQEWKTNEANYYLRYTVYGNVTQKMWWFPPQFAKAMKRFLKFFEHNVEQIDENMVATVCNNQEVISYFKKPFEARPMKEFWDNYMSITTGPQKSKYKRLHGENPDRYINWQIDTIFRDLTKLNIDQPSIWTSSTTWNKKNDDWATDTKKQLANALQNKEKK